MNVNQVRAGILKLISKDGLRPEEVRELGRMLDLAFEWRNHPDDRWKFPSLEDAVLDQTDGVDIFALKKYIDKVRRKLPPSVAARASVVDAVFEARAARFTSAAPPRVPAA